MSKGLKIQHAKQERGSDLYQTPPEAVHALLAAENLPPGLIWEPACGPGAIVRVLRAAGHRVHASDLNDYGTPEQDEARRDFLLPGPTPPGVAAIVTNPPYKLAADFVRRALDHAPLVIMLLRLVFLEGDRRRDILDGGKLARVHIFRNRLPMMHRADWNGPKATNAVAFAWMVWEREHRGSPTINRVSWTKQEEPA